MNGCFRQAPLIPHLDYGKTSPIVSDVCVLLRSPISLPAWPPFLSLFQLKHSV